MSGIKLRPYQVECIDAVFGAWGEGLRRPAVVLPTGAGKTVVFSHLIEHFRAKQTGPLDQFKVDANIGSRVMVLVHRDELADQAISKIKATLPGDVSIGKVKAESNEITADVMVCSVQTLASQTRRSSVVLGQLRYGDVGLIITDECHHAAAPSYRKVYDAFPYALQLGVTATLARGDNVGLGDVWEEVVYSKSILWMISKGYLSDVRTQRIVVENLDMGDVKASRGDYQAGDLGRALEESHADTIIAKAYREHASDRQGIVFTPTVATAEAAAEELNAAGVVTAVLSGETPRDERLAMFEGFRTGRIQVLSNCMVLTEGFDAPWASCAVVARPTQSAPLYTQMVGRVLRTWPGKKDALVLDLIGASSNKLRTLIDLEPGVVSQVEDGELLTEAVIREAEALDRRVPAGSIAYELKLREVNMFEGSDVAWHRTEKGVLFIDCGPDDEKRNRWVFLHPSVEPGLWDVCGLKQGGRAGAFPGHTGLDLSSAMAWGEVVAEDRGAFSVRRSASWRKGKPTEPQLVFAQGLGIDTTGLNKGQVSEALSTARASRYLDALV